MGIFCSWEQVIKHKKKQERMECHLTLFEFYGSFAQYAQATPRASFDMHSFK